MTRTQSHTHSRTPKTILMPARLRSEYDRLREEVAQSAAERAEAVWRLAADLLALEPPRVDPARADGPRIGEALHAAEARVANLDGPTLHVTEGLRLRSLRELEQELRRVEGGRRECRMGGEDREDSGRRCPAADLRRGERSREGS